VCVCDVLVTQEIMSVIYLWWWFSLKLRNFEEASLNWREVSIDVTAVISLHSNTPCDVPQWRGSLVLPNYHNADNHLYISGHVWGVCGQCVCVVISGRAVYILVILSTCPGHRQHVWSQGPPSWCMHNQHW
jgi:hypothetical protein